MHTCLLKLVRKVTERTVKCPHAPSCHLSHASWRHPPPSSVALPRLWLDIINFNVKTTNTFLWKLFMSPHSGFRTSRSTQVRSCALFSENAPQLYGLLQLLLLHYSLSASQWPLIGSARCLNNKFLTSLKPVGTTLLENFSNGNQLLVVAQLQPSVGSSKHQLLGQSGFVVVTAFPDWGLGKLKWVTCLSRLAE